MILACLTNGGQFYPYFWELFYYYLNEVNSFKDVFSKMLPEKVPLFAGFYCFVMKIA